MVQRELATFLWGSSANMDTFVRQWEEPVPIPPSKQTNKRIHKDFSPIVTTHVNNHVVNRKRVIYSILFPSFFSDVHPWARRIPTRRYRVEVHRLWPRSATNDWSYWIGRYNQFIYNYWHIIELVGKKNILSFFYFCSI